MKLGKLSTVELRSYWKHEAYDFTRWLAKPENIELLSDEIGISIHITQTEASVGRFNVDILAEEENTGRKIIIENQLERTDHGHLGQIITYAAGLETEYVVWIVRDVREEHRQAIDWLNERTDEHIQFFLVAIELWQIDNSAPAPKFKIICRPNEWKRAVQSGARDGELSEIKTKQLEFWQQFKEYAAINHPQLKLRTPRPQHWFDISIGRSGYYISLIVDTRENKVRCELNIPDSKPLYHTFLSNRESIEKQLNISDTLEWQEMPGKKASRIRALKNFEFNDESTWEESFAWLTETSSRFKQVFSKNWKPKEGSLA